MSSTIQFPEYCSRLGEFISAAVAAKGESDSRKNSEDFSPLALELFGLQFEHNEKYGAFCRSRKATPATIGAWDEIPAVPAAAFKDDALTCLAAQERTHVFHSSGTTEHRPSRHFHSADSLRLYEQSLWPWLKRHLLGGLNDGAVVLSLTPPPEQASRSSLVHMFATVGREYKPKEFVFAGEVISDGSWQLNQTRVSGLVEKCVSDGSPVVLLGTAFSYIHLIDHLAAINSKFQLPPLSRALETGGYKGRSRAVSRDELHSLIEQRLGIPQSEIVSEYGMSELSSQAYDTVSGNDGVKNPRSFRFPPWARVQIVSPETGEEVALGEPGLIKIFDLANAYSVMAIQTEDLGIRQEEGFTLLGRAAVAEARGCSLMPAG